MRGQKEIVEFVILSAASLLILTLVSINISQLSDTMKGSQSEAALRLLAEDVARSVVSVYSQREDIRLFLDLPREIGGRTYSVVQTNEGGSCGGRCLKAVSGPYYVFVKLNNTLDASVVGKIYSSQSQRPAVSYNSTANLVTLEMIQT